MNKDNERFIYLLHAYTSGNITAGEHDEFFRLIATHKYDKIISGFIQADLADGQFKKTADLPPHIAEEIVRNIFRAEKDTRVVLPVKNKIRYMWRWAAAAAVLIIAATFYFLVSPSRIAQVAEEPPVTLIPGNTIIKTNTSQDPEIITLPDKSRVTLQPRSTIQYASSFSGNKREVLLEGEAFFRVTKDPSKPFLVYYNKIVTRVLGTSFSINTNSTTGNVEVSVKTGKVQVYENDKLLHDPTVNKAVIITPNQKAVYKPRERIFETTLVEKPQPIVDEAAEQAAPVPFVYEQETLKNVFRHIEANYGIEIILENASLNNCVFTGDVSAQDLDTKLKFICLATNSSYEINGTKILIKGNGCN